MSSPSLIEITKKETMRVVREYCKEMRIRFDWLDAQMEPLQKRGDDLSKSELKRLVRLEKEEQRHMEHVERLAALLAELGPDEGSYC